MVEIFYRYRVHPNQKLAFEHAYGTAGPWVSLFSRYPGYRRTRLFRHRREPDVYITVDVWDSKGDWDRFRSEAADEYARLGNSLRMLYLEEHLMGYYEGEDEYRAPSDSLT